MPRHHAPLKSAIWDDPDWRTLSAAAQRMYMQLLSQKRLTLAGVMPYSPRNLARGCDELTVADVEAAISELVDRQYVIVDRDTDELLVRTLVKHDPPRGAKTIAGMWNAWNEIDSADLKTRVIHSLPAAVWGPDTPEPPETAKALRDAPSDGAFHERNRTVSEKRLPPATYHQPPATGHRPLSTGSVSTAGDTTTADPTEPTTTTSEKDTRFETVVALVVEQQIERHGSPNRVNPERYRATCTNNLLAQHGPTVRQWLDTHPDASPDLAARAITQEISR